MRVINDLVIDCLNYKFINLHIFSFVSILAGSFEFKKIIRYMELDIFVTSLFFEDKT